FTCIRPVYSIGGLNMSKNNRVFVIFFSILLFLTVGMSEKAYAEQISGTVHNELVGTFDKSQTSNRTIEEVDCKINPNAVRTKKISFL
ncbi:hypothetical protein, partial [Lactiplantibacillus plantarum]|uniref:hypothetical protein n=4 Tax=Lactobacillales TaxID=186826 RepID=UPI001C9E2130